MILLPIWFFSLLVKYQKLAEYLNAVECDMVHATSEVKRVVDSVVNQEIVILRGNGIAE